MAIMSFTVKHGRAQDEARTRLEKAVEEVRSTCGSLLESVEWSDDRSAVTMKGSGVLAVMRVDGEAVHAEIDIPALAGLFGNSLAGRLKEIVQKQLARA